MIKNYNDETPLEMVELYAAEKGYISSAAEASEQFDQDIMPGLIEKYGRPGYAFDDTDALCQAWGEWMDSECKEGNIHPLQYDQYDYEGKFQDVYENE